MEAGRAKAAAFPINFIKVSFEYKGMPQTTQHHVQNHHAMMEFQPKRAK